MAGLFMILSIHAEIILRSAKSKIPSDCSKLIELMFEVIKNEKESVFDMLQCHEMIITREGECAIFSRLAVETYKSLLSTREKAITKVIAHAK